MSNLLGFKELFDKFFKHEDVLRKTINRKTACYFKFGEQAHIEVKITEHNLIEFKYKPNVYDQYHLNYDIKNDSLVRYKTSVAYAGHNHKRSPKQNMLVLHNLRTLCTEEGFFQEMTRQDLTDLYEDDIVRFMKLVDKIIQRREYENEQTSTSV